MDKTELRKLYRAKRKQLSEVERETLSNQLTQRFLEFLTNHQDLKHIHVFLPIAKLNEVNTFGLVDKLLDRGMVLYTSVTDFKTESMQTIRLERPLAWVEDSYGIPVPHNYQNVDGNLIQLVLIPLVAYDLEGNRLGYGKGFYDRFLESLPQAVIKAGMSYFHPEETIPEEEHDIRLDFCLTPDKIFEFKNY
jgi:5-formyltetrahydrofolate cyclo-ligase